MGDLCGEGLVVHEEKLDVGCVVDEESLVSGWHHVAGLLVGTETNRWHNHLSLETSSDTVINTLRLSPACVDTFVGIALMSVETLGALLDDRNVLLSGNHLVVGLSIVCRWLIQSPAKSFLVVS